MALNVTELLAGAVKTALHAAALPAPEAVAWEIPREAQHGDYATNVAMTLARPARRPPRQVAEAIVRHLPAVAAIERVEIAGPGFLNVFLAPQWCAEALREILLAGERYGRSDLGMGRRYRIEFVSANPTGPLVIVNARAAAVGDALARILRSQGFQVACQYYVNDAGTQFQALASSMEVRLRQALGESAELPENAYPGEYLVDLARDYLARDPAGARAALALPAGERLERLGRLAVDTMVAGQRRVLEEYGTAFDRWTYEATDVRAAGLPEQAIDELRAAGFIYEAEGALWFRSTTLGDDKDRVLRKSDGELTYFAVDIGFHHFGKFADVDCVIDLLGPDHHGYIPRLKAAMTALGHPEAAFDVLIVQLVTLLRDGQPVRMSKRRGEFVLMEELLEEVGRDAARFTFLTRRHDSPLEFDLAVATRQSADNPVFYVQYAHARVTSLFRTAAQQGVAVPPWGEVDFGRLALPEEQTIIKRLLQYPELVAGAARAREPHRIAYYLSELAGIFHPYYKAHRILTEDRPLSLARLGLCAAVGQVVRSGLGLLGVSAPESM
ncbi:MAG: arginine--tRNA ligase [candidate division NC10 bacterium]